MTADLAIRSGLPGEKRKNAYILPPDLGYEEWVGIRNLVEHIVDASPWWLVDAVTYGEQAFPDQYTQSLPTAEEDPNGIRQGRLKQAAWMGQKYARNQRLPSLSYTHHRAAAELDPDERRELLAYAAEQKLSTRELIGLVKERQATEGRVLAASSETGCAADGLVWHPSADDLDPDVLSDLKYAEATSTDRSFLAGALWALAYLESEDSFKPGCYQGNDATAIFGPPEGRGEEIMGDTLYTVESGDGAAVVGRIIDVLFPDAVSVIDATFGNGQFWDGNRRVVVGMDRNPERARDVCGDFTRLPFRNGSADLVIFDPPYITNPSHRGTCQMAGRFGAYPSLRAMQVSVEAGCREAWRVARLGVLVKVQDQIRGARWVEMTEWVREAIGQPPYQRIDALRTAPKIRGANWTDQLSAYGNGATYLAFRHGDQRHIRRQPAATGRQTA